MQRTFLRTAMLLTGLCLLIMIVSATLAPSVSAQGVTVVSYVVQPGDTLAKIASKYCTTWEEIYSMNARAAAAERARYYTLHRMKPQR